ncbi:MFS transporter [Bacillus carboniphilus]|uniref:MFS transporter n=1 Tax=Bacillus carboniphilus TaxID=86663 RepID=A0ABP3FKG6_9BACI
MWNRNFLIIILGVGVSSIGLWVGIIGNLEFLARNVESSFLQALIILAGFVVGVFLAPMAGRVIDRSEKKRVLMITSFVRTVAIGFMFLAIAYNSVAWMVVYTFVIGITVTFANPAMQTVIPRIVPKEHLLAANGVYMNIFTGARIVGTALGGVMIVAMSLNALYLVTMISYFVLLIATAFLRIEGDVKTEVKEKKKENFVSTFTELWPVIKGKPMVINGLLLMIPCFFFLAGFNLMVIEIGEMQGNPGIKGILYTAEGLAVLVGTFMAKRFFKDKQNIKPLLLITLFISLTQLSLFFADVSFMPVVSFAIFGLAAGSLFPIITTIFQTEIPESHHGRFFSIRGMVENIIFQILMLLTGFFLDTIGFKKMVIVFGVISLLFLIGVAIKRMGGGEKQKVKVA